MPTIHLLDPEVAHRLGIFLTKYSLVPSHQNNSKFLVSYLE